MKLEPNKELIGKRITLRKWDATFDNANKLHDAKINNSQHISPWLHWALPEFTKNAEGSYTFLQDAEKKWNDGKNFEYGIYENETGDIIGGLGLRKVGMFVYMQYEIGYWLTKDACGKGYMNEAVALIEDEFFGLGTERLVIRADVENTGSYKIAEKRGFTFEGILRHALYSHYHKEFRDLKIYSKLSSEHKS